MGPSDILTSTHHKRCGVPYSTVTMLKISVNFNQCDGVVSYSVGQRFPEVRGRLVSVEASGKELSAFLARQELPVFPVENMTIAWTGKHAGRALQVMREIFGG